MPLLKIPVVILVSWAFTKCITPPQPPPSKSEKLQSSADVEWYTQRVLPIAVAIQWCAAAVEVVTIIASSYPTSLPAQFILTMLVLPGGRPENLKLHTVTALGGLMIVVGSVVRMITYRYLGRFFRYEASIQEDHELIVNGPYAVVRHPSYTGLLFSHPGWYLWQLGRGSWVRESGLLGTLAGKLAVAAYAHVVVFGTVYTVLRRMRVEDGALRARFGAEWERWAERVPYSVIPWVY